MVGRIGEKEASIAGYTLRGSSDSLVRLVLQGMIDGKRERGRQRRVWASDVKSKANGVGPRVLER